MVKKSINNNIEALAQGILENLENSVEETHNNKITSSKESTKVRKTFVLTSETIEKINILKAISPDENFSMILENAISLYLESKQEEIRKLSNQLNKFK